MSKTEKAKLKRQSWEVEPEILLCDNIPRPMHGMAPRVVFNSRWWDKTRRKAYKSTSFCCKACGVLKFNARGRSWLEAHEVYEIDYLLGRMVYIKTVPLCHYCHSYIHSGRLLASVESGEIKASKFVAVQQHGDDVLLMADLKKPEPYSGPEADWKDWRLVIDGEEYEGLYKSFEEWKKVYDA
jgi:hypothetical protein